nr:reverse transcriptase domain-containing protein [Tanacetum cinerariifolium]
MDARICCTVVNYLGTLIKSDVFPNHPTSDIEDAFSFNFPDYIPASPDYVPTLSGNTPSESLNNSYGFVPIAMAPKRTSTSVTLAMTQAAIRQLVADSVATALEAQAANMENADNTNRNPEPREAPPIEIEEAYKITWSEFKNLLIKKYCPRIVVKKMEDEFYNLIVKGNDLKTYVRRFHEFYRRITPKIEGKNPSELMLSTQLRTVGILETFPCVEDVDYVIQDFVVLCVRFATRWATRPSTAKTKSQPLETTEMKSYPYSQKKIEAMHPSVHIYSQTIPLYLPTKSRDEISFKGGRL